MSNNNLFDGLIQDLDRTRKRQKVCKKNINENINNVTQALQNTLNAIKTDNKIDEVELFIQNFLSSIERRREIEK